MKYQKFNQKQTSNSSGAQDGLTTRQGGGQTSRAKMFARAARAYFSQPKASSPSNKGNPVQLKPIASPDSEFDEEKKKKHTVESYGRDNRASPGGNVDTVLELMLACSLLI